MKALMWGRVSRSLISTRWKSQWENPFGAHSVTHTHLIMCKVLFKTLARLKLNIDSGVDNPIATRTEAEKKMDFLKS